MAIAPTKPAAKMCSASGNVHCGSDFDISFAVSTSLPKSPNPIKTAKPASAQITTEIVFFAVNFCPSCFFVIKEKSIGMLPIISPVKK